MTEPLSPLLARAHRTPHHRTGIRELQKSAPTAERVHGLTQALAVADERAVRALAFSLAIEDALPVDLLPAILCDVEEPPLAVLLFRGAAGDRIDALGRLFDDEVLTEDAEAYLLFLATERLGFTSPVPPAWLVRLRRIARRLPTLGHPPTEAYLERALGHFTEDVIQKLAARPKKRLDADPDELLEVWDAGLEAALGDEEAPRLVATVTVKSEGPKVGRNDPCPCGSGKKFKKCHGQDKEAEVRGPIDAAALSKDDLSYLRMADLSALELTKLKKATLEAALSRAITFRRWSLARRMAVVLDGEARGSAHLSLSLGAIDAGRWDVVDELIEGWPGELPAELTTHRELRRIAPSLDELSRMTAAMLADPKSPLFELGLGLLHRAPGVGIPFARGLITELPVADGDALVEEIERARDVLALPPGDPAITLVEALDQDDARRERQAQAVKAESDQHDALRATLARTEEALSARQAEVTSLAMRLEEAEEEVARLAARPLDERAPKAPAASAEKKKWSARVEELKALVQEGNKERAILRRQITELSEELDARTSAEPGASPSEPAETAETDELDASPRAPVVPTFARAAVAALPDLPLRIRRQAIELSGTLASGDPAAWRNVKQMEGVAKVWSARLGIHHRLLFRAHDDTLEVLDVVTREDLLKSLERWR